MRRLIVLAAPIVAALALGACGGGQRNTDPRPAPPDVASNFNGPLDARGIDPAWGLTIRGLQITLERPNQPGVTIITAPGVNIQAHQATWSGALPNGQTMKVTFYGSPCVDGTSSATFPFSAEVQLPDSAPLSGCGGPPAGAKPAAAKR